MSAPLPFPTDRHRDEIPPSSVHPIDYVGNDDPADDPANDVAPGKRWLKGDWDGGLPGTREQYIRNAANSAWVKIGEYPLTDGAFAPVVDVSGLAGDGTTDDTTALQALITANPDDVVFDGGGKLYEITALVFPACNRITFRNFRFTVPGDTVPISASGLVYDCRFESIFITAGSQSTGGRRIWDFTNFSNCTFRHIRTFGVDNVSDHWYGTKNGAGSAPYYNRWEECYGGVCRNWFYANDLGSTATGPNANTIADCRIQPGARTAVKVSQYCQSLIFQNVTIEGSGTAYEIDGKGCTVRGGYIEGPSVGIHFTTNANGCVVDFPYFSGVTTKVDDDGTDNVVFGHRDDIGTVVDNITNVAGGNTVNVEDEGSPEGAADTIDFVGSGVSVSYAGGTATVTVSGGSGVDLEDEGTPVGTFDTIDFTGSSVTVTDDGGGHATVAVTGGGSLTLQRPSIVQYKTGISDSSGLTLTGTPVAGNMLVWIACTWNAATVLNADATDWRHIVNTPGASTDGYVAYYRPVRTGDTTTVTVPYASVTGGHNVVCYEIQDAGGEPMLFDALKEKAGTVHTLTGKVMHDTSLIIGAFCTVSSNEDPTVTGATEDTFLAGTASNASPRGISPFHTDGERGQGTIVATYGGSRTGSSLALVIPPCIVS